MQAKLSQVDAMSKKIAELQSQVESNQAASHILSELIVKGDAVQDEHGNVQVVKHASPVKGGDDSDMDKMIE